MTPEWQKLAGALKRSVKIAYWDTEQGANPPKLIGQIKGTPTIKFIIPSKKNKKGKYNKKTTLDYNGERELKPMKEYAEAHMPNSVVRLNSQKAHDAFIEKADKYGLPKVLVFSKKPSSATLKGLSTEFRRRLLIGEVKGTSANKALLAKYKVKDFPTVLVLRDDGEHVKFAKKPSYNALNFFLSKYALKKPVDGAKKVEEPEPDAQAKTEKTEL